MAASPVEVPAQLHGVGVPGGGAHPGLAAIGGADGGELLAELAELGEGVDPDAQCDGVVGSDGQCGVGLLESGDEVVVGGADRCAVGQGGDVVLRLDLQRALDGGVGLGVEAPGRRWRRLPRSRRIPGPPTPGGHPGRGVPAPPGRPRLRRRWRWVRPPPRVPTMSRCRCPCSVRGLRRRSAPGRGRGATTYLNISWAFRGGTRPRDQRRSRGRARRWIRSRGGERLGRCRRRPSAGRACPAPSADMATVSSCSSPVTPSATAGLLLALVGCGSASLPLAGSARYGNVSAERGVVGVDAVTQVVRVAHELALDDLQRDVDDVVSRAAGRSGSPGCRHR